MFRNQYDSDVTVWSPQGRIFQVEYAMEAVKQGNATVGIKNNDMAVILALCRTSQDADLMQRKIMPIDTHLGVSIAGLTADAHHLCQFLRTECLAYRHAYNMIFPVRRLANTIGNKLQATTQRYDRRPFGVGIIMAGYDEQGPHIFQIMPSANVLNCKAMAIGARSQSARTYLERHLENFHNASKDEIICHGIQAIRGALGIEEVNPDLKINVAYVGKNQPFIQLTDEQNENYLKMAKEKEKAIIDHMEHDGHDGTDFEAEMDVTDSDVEVDGSTH